MPDIIMTSNSPGELSSWVRVTSQALLARQSALRLHVALVPCPYASGRELDYARQIPGLTSVLAPGQTMRLLLGRPGFRPSKEAVVVFLGGELWQASRLAHLWGVPGLAYAVRPSRQARAFERIAVPNPDLVPALIARGVEPRRVVCVGDLMVDGVALPESRETARQALGLALDRPVLGLFPGSRSPHLRAALPLFLRVAERLARSHPELQFLLVLSPFVSLAAAQQALDQPFDIGVERSWGHFGRYRLKTRAGLEVVVTQGRPHQSMGALDLALTIPGTNTAELACAGCPMVLVLSTRAPLPRGGLGGLLDLMPLGAWKEQLRLKEYLRFPHGVAQPNLRARRKLVPEVILQDSLDPLISVLGELARDSERRAQISRELRVLMGVPGAGERLADQILETLGLPLAKQYA